MKESSMEKSISMFNGFEGYMYKLVRECIKDPKALGLSCGYKSDPLSEVESQDFDDLYQEGRLLLWRAIKDYPRLRKIREEQNSKVEDVKLKRPIGSASTFVYLYLRSGLLNIENRRWKVIRDKKNTSITHRVLNDRYQAEKDQKHIDDTLSETLSKCSFESGSLSSPEVVFDVKRILESLTPDERDIVELLFLEKKSRSFVSKKFPMYNIQRVVEEVRERFSVLKDDR